MCRENRKWPTAILLSCLLYMRIGRYSHLLLRSMREREKENESLIFSVTFGRQTIEAIEITI